MARDWRKEYESLRNNPERWAKHKATVRDRRKQRYNDDPEYKAAHKARNSECQKQKLRDPVGWAKRIIIRLRHKCKQQGIPFDITHEDIPVPTHCPVFGTELILGGTDGYKDWNSPSIDRVIPALGYVKGNVHVISVRANTIKNDASAEELRKVAAYIDATTL